MKESHKSVCEHVFNRINVGGILLGTGIEKCILYVYISIYVYIVYMYTI